MIVFVSIAAAAFLAAATAGTVLRRRLRIFTVRGDKHVADAADRQRVLVRTGHTARRADLAVFRTPEPCLADDFPWLVKRVVAVAGDAVPSDVRDLVPDAVPDGVVVVRGDHPGSLGSRDFGYVPTESVLGVVVRLLRAC